MVRQRSRNPLHPEVASHSRPGLWHQVILDAYRGNGSCECEHFVCRLERELAMGAEPGDATRCQHIVEARAELLDATIQRIAAVMKAAAADERNVWQRVA